MVVDEDKEIEQIKQIMVGPEAKEIETAYKEFRFGGSDICTPLNKYLVSFKKNNTATCSILDRPDKVVTFVKRQ